MLTQCLCCYKVHDQSYQCPERLARKKEWAAKRTDDPKVKKFRSSAKWANLRSYIVERDGGCVVCKDHGQADMDTRLEVHHIVSLRENWDLRLDPDNLCTLCFAHHNYYEGKDEYKKYLRSLVKGDDEVWVV